MQTKHKELRMELRRYLGQYYRAKLKKAQLETRLYHYRLEMSGAKGLNYSPLPPSGNGSGSSIEEQVIRAVEFEERIAKQQEQVQRAMLVVLEVMEYLPIDSTWRTVLEYRHLDCLSWKEIGDKMHITRTTCNRYYNAGIHSLLNEEQVLERLRETRGRETI